MDGNTLANFGAEFIARDLVAGRSETLEQLKREISSVRLWEQEGGLEELTWLHIPIRVS